MPGRNAWYGCNRDKKNFNDHPMALPFVSVTEPIDLRQWAPAVMNQSSIGSCTAHGVTGAARWYINKRGTTYDFDMSRLQLYWDSRALEETTASDSGAEIRDVVKTLSNRGVGHEELWQYDITRFDQQPPQEVYDDAVQYRALKYERVPVATSALKSALAAGHPIVIGISIYASFESDEVARTGIVPMPVAGEGMMGGHCMYVVGWKQKPGYFTVRNSWGDDWGDKGDCYLPEGYLGSQNLGSDYWIVSMFGSPAEQSSGAA